MKMIHIRIPNDMHTKIKAMMVEYHMSMSDVMRMLLSVVLENRKEC